MTDSYFIISPSFILTVFFACLAISTSCVIIMIVFPSLFNFLKICIISSPDFESKFPVGSKSCDEIMHIFQKLNKEGKTIIMITHEVDIARHAKKTVRIKDGEIMK